MEPAPGGEGGREGSCTPLGEAGAWAVADAYPRSPMAAPVCAESPQNS